MDMEKVTIDLILNWLKEAVEAKRPISPLEWLDAAQKLNALKQDETELLHKMQQDVAKTKLYFLGESKSVAEAKLKTEATDEYKFMRDQMDKIEMVEEQIRLAKIQARLGNEQFKGY
jgi:hypothetical protein